GRRRRGLSDRGRPRKYTRINSEAIDYKDLNLLRRFISDRGKTRSRRVTGLSRKHQQQLALAVKRARELALLPYVGERYARGPGRSAQGRGGPRRGRHRRRRLTGLPAQLPRAPQAGAAGDQGRARGGPAQARAGGGSRAPGRRARRRDLGTALQ